MFLRLLWDIVVLRLVAYLEIMICLILQILYKILHNTFWYNFDTVLYQFLETGISDKCLICLNQLLKISGFSHYPLSFFIYSTFKWDIIRFITLISSSEDISSRTSLISFSSLRASLFITCRRDIFKLFV